MEAFQTVVFPDIVDVLRQEHTQIRQLCADVRKAGTAGKAHAVAALQRAVHLHRLGELALVHPATRNSGRDGHTIALACQTESAKVERALTDVGRVGVGHPDFDSRFTALAEALLQHAETQERDEFPLLRRRVPPQRLHMMAGAMQDVRIMALD
jgi:hypothetical protein